MKIFKDYDIDLLLGITLVIVSICFVTYLTFSHIRETNISLAEKAIIVECIKNDKCLEKIKKEELSKYFTKVVNE